MKGGKLFIFYPQNRLCRFWGAAAKLFSCGFSAVCQRPYKKIRFISKTVASALRMPERQIDFFATLRPARLESGRP